MYQFKGFAPKAAAALNQALRAAEESGHTYIGTEHIVWGLLRVEDSIAAVILHSLGLQAAEWEKAVGELEGRGSPTTLTVADFSPRARAVMDPPHRRSHCRDGGFAYGAGRGSGLRRDAIAGDQKNHRAGADVKAGGHTAGWSCSSAGARQTYAAGAIWA